MVVVGVGGGWQLQGREAGRMVERKWGGAVQGELKPEVSGPGRWNSPEETSSLELLSRAGDYL